jgi:PAS domain S-box-containing protein
MNFEQLFQSMTLGVVYFDSTGKAMQMNAAAQQMMGISIEQLSGLEKRPERWQIVGKNGEDFHFDQSPISKVLETGEMMENIEIGIYRPDKNTFIWLLVSVHPEFRDSESKPYQVFATLFDISDKKLIEAQLNQSNYKLQAREQMLMSLVNTQTSYVIRTDIFGRITYWNNKFEEDYGWAYREKGIRKSSALDSICEHHHGRVNQAVVDSVAQSGSVIRIEFDKPREDGVIQTTLWEFLCLTDEVGVPTEIQCMGIDITEQRRADERLKESERKFRSLFFDSPEAYLIIRDGIFIECNSSAGVLFGCTRNDLVGKTPAMISPEYQADQQKSDELALNFLQRADEEKFVQFEWTHKRLDGTEFLASVRLSAMQYDGEKAVFVVLRDISLEKESAEQLRKLSYVINQSPTSIFITNMTGEIEYANPATSINKGYLPEEIIGSNPRIWKSPDASEAFYQKMWGNVLSGEKWQGYIKNKRKDGVVIWEFATIFPIQNDKGQITNFAAIQENVTELKGIEESLVKSEKRLAQIAEHGKSVIWEIDLDGLYTYVSPLCESVFGYTVEETINKKHFYDLFPDDLRDAYVTKSSEFFMRDESLIDFENPVIKKSGEQIWVSTNCTAIKNDQGEIIGYIGADTEITERKKYQQEIVELNQSLEKKVDVRTAEIAKMNEDLREEISYRSRVEEELKSKSEELETFFSAAQDLMCIADLKATLIKVNAAWKTILGYETYELEGMNFMDLVHVDDISPMVSILEQLNTHKLVSNFVIRLIGKNGNSRYIEWSAAPVGGYIFAASRDITERLKQENELRNAQELANQANISKSEFLSRISHELRTPMNSILGFAQLLEMGSLDNTQERSVGHILQSGKHLLNLINEVLEISRIESGQMSLSMEPVSLNSVIHEIIDSLTPLAATRGITIHSNFLLGEMSYVMADRQRLKQIIMNLLSNGLKYNRPDGMIDVEVLHGENEFNGKKSIRIAVRDQGYGISPDNMEKVFLPFERIGAENTETEGTGLGLAVVKQLTELMNGELGLESTLGTGSTFWVEFVSANEQVLFDDTDASVQKSVDMNPHHGTILYIEDNSANVDLVQQIVEMKLSGVKLITNASGLKAVQLASEHQPDLILLDLNLTDIHGSEVIQRLKKEPLTRDIPVVIMSADAMTEQIDRMMSLGANNYLTKPIDIGLFLKEVDKYLS